MTDSSSSGHSRFRLWSKENFPPKEFVKKYPLPQVACIHEGGGTNGQERSPTSMVDLEQPFLLFKSYSSVKVHARSLQADSRRPSVQVEVGPTVAIPEDYTGWFAIVADSSGRSGPQTARHYTSVEQVATAQVPFFLVRNDTPAYKLHDLRTSGGKLVYTKTTIRTGHVLKLLGVFEDINSRHHSSVKQQPSQRSSLDLGSGPSGISDGKGQPTLSNTFKYAQCLNYKGEVVFLPFTAKGMFYATGTKGTTRNLDHVYLMSHLLKFSKFPVTVRLVCGFLPKVPCNFTGLLRLTCAKREEIILACTLLKERNVMLEMDMNSSFTLRKALNEERYTKFESYRSAVDFCADEAEIWRRQMKVMHFVFPDTSLLSSSSPPPPQQRSLPSTVHVHQQQQSRLLRGGSQKSTSTPPSSSSSSTNQKSQEQQQLKAETQSVCISMIFDDLDDADERKQVERRSSSSSSLHKQSSSRASKQAIVSGGDDIKDDTANKRKTKFWTLRRLKKFMKSNGDVDDSPYGVVRIRRTINDWVNDGSENANDEFTTRLPKDVGRSYVKLPGFQIPENGTYVRSPTAHNKSTSSAHPIYDAIT